MESATFRRVLNLVVSQRYLVSRHGLKAAADDDILVSDLAKSLPFGEAIEDYPGYHAGPCSLVLQKDGGGRPVHALWGIPKGTDEPAVLITCYRPDPKRWDASFRTRKA